MDKAFWLFGVDRERIVRIGSETTSNEKRKDRVDRDVERERESPYILEIYIHI